MAIRPIFPVPQDLMVLGNNGQWFEDVRREINNLSTPGGAGDHTLLTNIGTNSHAQIDSHIANTTYHFTEGSIDHTAIMNIGSNTHAQIDTHIADSTIHFTEGSVDHGNISGLSDDDHTQYILVTGTRAFTGGVHVDGGADEVQLTVKGHSTQTANLQEWQDSLATSLIEFDPEGNITANPLTNAVQGINDANFNFTSTWSNNSAGTMYGTVISAISTANNASVSKILTLTYAKPTQTEVFSVDTKGVIKLIANNGSGLEWGTGGYIRLVANTLESRGYSGFQWETNLGDKMKLFQDGSLQLGGTFGGSPSELLQINGQAAVIGQSDEVQFIVEAHSTQTSNLQEWHDSIGTDLAHISADGSFGQGGFDILRTTAAQTGGGLSNLLIGPNLAPINSGARVTAVGHGALAANGSSSNQTAFGGFALNKCSSGSGANTGLGAYSLERLISGAFNTAVGLGSLRLLVSGSYNTAFGLRAGYNALGNGSVFLGYSAGYFETGSNKLYISNTDTTTPLIYGEFDNEIAQINGAFRVTDLIPAEGNFLTVDANGELVDANFSEADITNLDKSIQAQLPVKEKSDVGASATVVIDTILIDDFGDYESIFWRTSISSKTGSNMRAGNITCVTDLTSLQKIETYTSSIGTTNDITFDVSINGTSLELTAVNSGASEWVVKSSREVL